MPVTGHSRKKAASLVEMLHPQCGNQNRLKGVKTNSIFGFPGVGRSGEKKVTEKKMPLPRANARVPRQLFQFLDYV